MPQMPLSRSRVLGLWAMRSFRRYITAPLGRLLKRLMQAGLRHLFRTQRARRRLSRAGFVFPTTMLLLLVVALTAGALTYRAYSRSESAILARQQQVIDNVATPAIDRSKAKIEYLFSSDTRSPRKVPTSNQLRIMLLGDQESLADEVVREPQDIYTLEDETRLDLDGDGTNDNAWYFSTGVGDQVVVYSITVDDANAGEDIDNPASMAKAEAQVTRNGPISTSEAPAACVSAGGGDVGQRSEEGWQIVSPSTVEKNIQVNAFVADLNDISGTATTLEFQQVREGDRSSKWGAWFRYDLEAYPGPDMPWNGAMHTQGSFILGNSFQSYMISSKNSCLYGEGASDMTVGRDISNTGFHGQLVLRNTNSGSPRIHFDRDNNLRAGNVQLSTDNHSIVEPTVGNDLAGETFREGIYLNPVKLYLSDISEHIDPLQTNWTSKDPNPTDDQEGRVQRFQAFNGRVQEVDPKLLKNLSLDDVFRADDRWGPKASYTDEGETRIDVPGDIGAEITDNAALTNASGGLDGYWERRAASDGTRFIVGERLELGNANGWNYDPTGGTKMDPLYPPDALPVNTETANEGRRQFGVAEQKQRRTLRDNLAAVQGMVVYRWDLGSGIAPQACIAVTAHHGTAQAIANSRTFRKTGIAANPIMTDFLTGRGTNGWQFQPVTNATSGDMKTALDNLSRFAGDPNGGAPSFTPEQDGFIHPYPYLSMWGDYAMLRRVGTSADSSIADQATQDTAACTMALLAYNLQTIKAEHDAIGSSTPNWSTIAGELTTAAARLASGSYAPADVQDLDYTAWQQAVSDAIAASEVSNVTPKQVEAGFRYWEVERDRTYGFETGLGLPGRGSGSTLVQTWTGTTAGVYNPAAATYTTSVGDANGVAQYTPGAAYNVTCDPNIFAEATTFGVTNEDDALSLALAFCPKKAALHRFPALFYLFPAWQHGYSVAGSTTIPAGINYAGVSTAAATVTIDISAEPYVDYVTGATSPKYNQSATFTALNYTSSSLAAVPEDADSPDGWPVPAELMQEIDDGGTPGDDSDDSFVTSDITAFDTTADSDWHTTANTTDGDPFRLDVVAADGSSISGIQVPLLDKIIYSGRENMAIRVLDMDVASLMANNWFYGKDPAGVEHFGLTYAFREDAVREDEIVRPSAGGTSDTCNTYAVLGAWGTNATCHMQIGTNPFLSKDPPLAGHKISAKPVDYRPDPDRRPYGFRLRNGADFGRANDVQSGLSFVTDNSVVIQGDFNLHGGGTLEEFSDFLMKSNFSFNNFYDRATLDLGRFANSTNDPWRPSEILADAVYIHSDSFRDGFVEAAYTNALGVSGGDGQGKVSFENMNILGDNGRNRPNSGDVRRENGGTDNVPIYFDRNGEAYRLDGNPLIRRSGNTTSGYYYWGFGDGADWRATRGRNQIKAQEVSVNTLLISGIVPSRPTQGYGGLHNFPRMQEDWDGVNQYISGGFYQLFFSHSATAPWDMNTWETGDPQRDERMFHAYQPPNRNWGYDVALQYSPPHPISLRFISVGNARSEFYRELPVDDPYIQVLRCAKKPDNTQIDPSANCA
jgi:hypothetical protein